MRLNPPKKITFWISVAVAAVGVVIYIVHLFAAGNPLSTAGGLPAGRGCFCPALPGPDLEGAVRLSCICPVNCLPDVRPARETVFLPGVIKGTVMTR